MDESDVLKALSEHPCYNEDAHHKFARMHIPVAPRCNIQCNYCNRKFDCCNESRPGVTSEVLSPQDALVKIGAVREKVPELKVIGIAGPGDPLANEETFQSLELIKEAYPDLTLCVSTNGLALPDCADRLFALNVRFLTVTMNCCDPRIGAEIYDSVVFEKKRYTGEEGARILMERQLDGIKRCCDLGMVVKINIVMIPGINDEHIPDLVKKVKSLGAYIVNILPLIPVEGTRFSDRRAPTPLERKALMDKCSIDARMMRHCRQCRADAIGKLGEDRSSEFVHFSGCGSGCGSSTPVNVSLDLDRDEKKVAVASTDGKTVDCGFGNTRVFRIYATDGGTCRFLEQRSVDVDDGVAGESHRKHIESIVDSINDCGTIIVKEIGSLPAKVLKNLGIKVIISEGDVESAVRDSL